MKSGKVMIQLGYVLGASALLTALGYFYASNWGLLNRFNKITPILVLMLGFYGLHIWLSRKPGRAFLSKLSLFASCITFGVGVAVVGQTYNSHADSYGLFAIWLIPALLFSVFTRWQPFYVLSYILAHISYGLYFLPRWGGVSEDEGMYVLVWLGFTLGNGVLFALMEKGKLRSPLLKWLAFQAAICACLIVSISWIFEDYGIWMNLALAAVLALAVWYAHRAASKLNLLFAGLWVSAAIVVKYFELVMNYHNEWFFLLSLLFVIVFIFANVKFMTYIRQWQPSGVQSEAEEELPQEGSAGKRRTSDFTKWVVHVLTVAVIIIGSLLGTVTLVGLVTVVLSIEKPENLLMGYGIAAFIAMLFLNKFNSLARYTVMISGMLIATGAALIKNNSPMLYVLLLLIVVAFALQRGLLQRIFFFESAVLMTAFILADAFRSRVTVVSLLTVLVLAVFCAGALIRRDVLRRPLLYSSFPTFLLLLFILTFITEGGWYYAVNAVFFVLVLAAAIWTKGRQLNWMYVWSIGFWTAFLVYKYYDLAWKLLHKSISLAIIGSLILAVTVWLERKREDQDETVEAPYALAVKPLLLGVVILLQVVGLGLQIGKSEWLLSHGTLVKLELQPLDPRSILQGDYIRLHYAISEPEGRLGYVEGRPFKGKLAVVLGPNSATGIYEYKRMYQKGETLAPGEVRLNGKRNGYDTVEYGIESYFIPEGSGREYEGKVKYAEARISASGDAILVGVSDN
ncbi:GDYXXLXY domain-containing protein [Paenibacillus whitsoniae]|uniref:DUF2157 domain-containing protein n=1 Tax=Paenibacillus whitsoniae TaxID=2496558 RepID=A0A430JFL1_9BACL|nr:GDYXXLXY domain-containing protein [Paenibacillus whitsoniae]RTE09765.1 DUF2157 domain-containing protein [Paenibacillus whitsoniae]